MKRKQTIAQINTLSLQPQSSEWIAINESSYYSNQKNKRRLLLTTLLIGGFLYFYNPIASYQPKAIQTNVIQLSTAELTAKPLAPTDAS